MISKISALFSQPFPYYLGSDRKNLLLNLSISLFTCLFLVVFQPWEDEVDRSLIDYCSYALICFIVLNANVILGAKIFSSWFDIENWTFGKFMGLNIFNMLLIGLFIWPYNVLTCADHLIFHDLMMVQYKTFTLGVIITTILFFFLQYKGLRKQLSYVRKKDSSRNTLDTEFVKTIAIQSDTSETLSIKENSFLFAQAQDNYTEIHWDENGEHRSKLLRLSLRNLENQLSRESILRTHRSYLVNFDKIKSYSGNSNGMKLQLDNEQNNIPVSRSFVKFIEAYLPK